MFEDICSRMLMILTLNIEPWTMNHHKPNDLPRPVGAPANDKQYKVQLSSRPSVTNRINFIAKRWFLNEVQAFPLKTLACKLEGRDFFIGQHLKLYEVQPLWSRTVNPIDIYFLSKDLDLSSQNLIWEIEIENFWSSPKSKYSYFCDPGRWTRSTSTFSSTTPSRWKSSRISSPALWPTSRRRSRKQRRTTCNSL